MGRGGAEVGRGGSLSRLASPLSPMDLKSIKGALKSAAGKASKAAHEAGISAYASAKGAVANAASTATGALRCTREYDLDAPVAASGGPGCLFTVVDATRRCKGGATSKAAAAAAAAADPTTPNSRVSVWLLDKRALTEDGRHSNEEVEQMLQLIRDDASRMLKLRHPGVLRLEQPLEETRTHLALVTEPVFASAADVLAKGANLAGKRRERAKSLEQATGGGAVGAAGADSSSGRGPSRGETEGARLAATKLSQLEVKHGAAALAGALRFIHESAGLVLRGLNPGCVVVTSRGDWKIGVGAFAHARGGIDGGNRADFYLGPSGAVNKPLNVGYGSSDSEAFVTGPLPLVPPAGYVAPELVLGAMKGGYVGAGVAEPTGSADVFSLGAIVHELAGNPPLLGEACCASVGGGDVGEGEYRRGLANARFVGGCASVVSRMCAEDPGKRIGSADVTSDAWFANDVGLAALRELDGFIQSDVLSRAAFLQSLQGRWDLFDARVTQYRVLPPLLTELRTPELQPLVLPLILNLAERQTPTDFSEWTLPHLAPLLATATGHTLGTILKSTAAFADRVPSPETFELYVLPAVLRGVAAPEVLVQEEALRQVTAAAHKVTPETLRCTVVPLLHKTAVDTTAAAVRVNALVALGKIAPCFAVPEFDATLDALHRIAANDRAAATVMCVLGVADAMGKVGGVNLIASRCLPLACPLMLAPGLNRAQIGTVSRVLGGMLRRVEEARVATAPPAPPPPKRPPASVEATAASGGIGGIGGIGGGADPFAASGAATDLLRGANANANAGEGTLATRKVGGTPIIRSSTPMRLTPPPGAVPRVSSATEQLTAALSAGDNLETLFTDPGYRPEPPGPMFAGMNVHPGVGAGAGRTGRGALDAKEFSLL